MNFQRLVRPVIVTLLFLPAPAWAQVSDTAAIAGSVRDTSGAVLPGRGVEASSPALIEKVRTVVTDGQGLYRNRRPAAGRLHRELLAARLRDRQARRPRVDDRVHGDGEWRAESGDARGNGHGHGASPVIDIQNVRQQTTLARSTLDALPTTGRISQYATVIPGAVLNQASTHSVGGLDERPQFGIHGSRAIDNVPVQDGHEPATAGGAVFVFNNLSFQEVVVRDEWHVGRAEYRWRPDEHGAEGRRQCLHGKHFLPASPARACRVTT